MKLVYIAGKYTGKTMMETKRNILLAEEAAIYVLKQGNYPVTPHLNTALFEFHCPEIKEKFWYDATLDLLERCDAILMLPLWQDSHGARGEYMKAIELKLLISFYKCS